MKKFLSRFRTLRVKIVFMLIVFSLIPALVIGISSYNISKKRLSDKLEKTSKQTVNEINRGLNTYFNAMSDLTVILTNDSFIKQSDNEDKLTYAKELLENINSTDENITNVFVGTEKGLFYINPEAELADDYNHKTRSWYTTTLENPGEITITDPYIDKATGNLVVSITGVIKDGNKVIGVAGIDVDLAALSKSLSEIAIGDSGYLYITDQNGVVIAHPDSTLIGTDKIAKESFWDKIKTNKQDFISYKLKGEKQFAIYDTSEITGWKIIATLNYSELSKDTSAIFSTLMLVLLCTIVFAIFMSILFSIPISKSIKALLAAFSRLSNGDLTATVTIKSKDEFHLLGKHFNEMASNISKLIQNVSEASITVLDTSITLSNMAEETNASLNEVARAVEEVAKGATEQAQNSSDGAASVSELSQELNSIQKSTDFMDSLSKNASELTLHGLQQVESLSQKSNHTMQSTAKVSELVFETSESMKQIDAISDTIDNITEQTNLLSLNASIEAARAGESGLGFAVVANEIRKLAEQSKSSTIKIKSIVEDISKKTALSVQAMEVTQQNVSEQVSLVNETQNVFREIMEAVKDLSNKVSEIKSNTFEINEKKDNIVYQIENISAISEESASATEEVTASTEQIAITMDEITKDAVELEKLSQLLKDRIHSFKF